MTRIVSIITGLLISLSLVTPTLAANVDVLRFDRQTNLAARVRDNSIEPRVRENYTDHDPVTRVAKAFDVTGYNANLRELRRYLQQFDCRMGVKEACVVQSNR